MNAKLWCREIYGTEQGISRCHQGSVGSPSDVQQICDGKLVHADHFLTEEMKASCTKARQGNAVRFPFRRQEAGLLRMGWASGDRRDLALEIRKVVPAGAVVPVFPLAALGVIPVMTQHYTMLHRNLLYTGVTRDKTLVVVGRLEESRRDRRPQHLGTAAVVEDPRMAGKKG